MSKATKKKSSNKAKSVTGEVIPAGEAETVRKRHPIGAVLHVFLAAIDDYRELVNVAIPALARVHDDSWKKAVARLDSFVEKKLGDGARQFIAKGVHAGRDLIEISREIERLGKSRLLPSMARSVFIGIFSEYDNFVGGLLKAAYLCKPELFKSIKREIALTELLDFGDLDAVKRDMLEKEIDSFRRESYVEQFAELERKFEIRTLREFAEWPKFVEMSQRRNVMTHNGGLVSEQYLKVCDREGYIFEKRPAVGEELRLPPSYMTDTLLIVSKVGFMLAHTLWRKLLPADDGEADSALNEALYNLLLQKRWKTASEFGRFGLTGAMLKNAREIDKRIRLVNTAIALKKLKKNGDAVALLNGVDWSACIREFKLAIAVLKQDYIAAAKVMQDIGKKGELLDQMAYHDWPLFEEFRDRSEFQLAYEKIYGIPFVQKVSEDTQKTSEILKNEMQQSRVISAPFSESAKTSRKSVREGTAILPSKKPRVTSGLRKSGKQSIQKTV